MESRNKEINPAAEEELALTEENADEENADEENRLSDAKADGPEGKIPFWQRVKSCPIFTLPFKVLCGIFGCSALVYILSRFIPNFAEFWTRYPAQCIRFVMAKLTGWIPFSLAEALLISLPAIAIGYLVASSLSTKRNGSDENFYRWLRPLVSLILVIVTIFLAGFGPAYGRFKLAKNLGLEQKDVSGSELYSTGEIVADELKVFIENIEFDSDGASIMPFDYRTLVSKMNAAFDKYAESAQYISHFRSNPKPIALSEPMTHTHISGVYTFMTGESNINTNYPDFLMPFTMAHEMAHQRGIAREDEANFVAYLVCIGSDDEYIRYSGYANMANYIASALNSADKEKYSELIINRYPAGILKEFIAYSDFFTKYRDSTASNVTGAVNNAFLQSQGQAAGTRSYGLVVDLAVAYHLQ